MAQTLRATIDWSYDLLTPDQQRAYRALSVFVGGFTPHAAATVAHTNHDLLHTLHNQNLLTHGTDEADQDRYRMLEVIREHARERLDDAGGTRETLGRHRAYCVALADALEPRRYGAATETEIARTRADRENFLAAVAGAVESADAPSALRLVRALADHWQQTGYLSGGLAMAQRALYLPGGDPADRAYVEGKAMCLAYELGMLAEARSLLARSSRVLRAQGDLCAQSLFLGQSGFYEAVHGYRELAVAHSELGVELAQAAGDHDLEMIATHALACALQVGALSTADARSDELARSLDLLERVLDWARERGTDHDVAAVIGVVGLTRHILGDHRAALQDMQEALRLSAFPEGLAFRDAGNVGYAAIALGHHREGVMLLSLSEQEQHRYGVATQAFDEQLRPRAEAAARSALGSSRLEEAKRDGSELTMVEAIELALALDPFV